MRRFAICLLVLACAAPALAQAGRPRFGQTFADLAAKQRLLLGNYCRLDFEGARLTPAGWQQIRQYTWLRNNPDFNTVIIVSRYQVVDNQTPSHFVYVNYVVVGRYEEGLGYSPSPGIRRVMFETEDIQRELRIKDVDPSFPFISRRGAIEWLKRRLGTAGATPERNIIENAIKALETSDAAGATRPKPAP